MTLDSATSPTPVPWVDREVDVPGRGRMSVREAPGPEGAPTLLLLHGLAATGRLNWATALPTLAGRMRGLGFRTSARIANRLVGIPSFAKGFEEVVVAWRIGSGMRSHPL